MMVQILLMMNSIVGMNEALVLPAICAQFVDVQFEDVLVRVERLDAAGEPYRT
jgi:hypothetical protein